ncbi:MAG: lipid asymmetry maintenance ABC transporter permease subunit MlaE [Acidiferrobacterales bacterium]|nr:lipid asymmetry maintenance ABC transporter permease subunit MlaE [Acidiferrobacterales bacterium]
MNADRLTNWIRSIGATALGVVERLGYAVVFLSRCLARFPKVVMRPSLIVQQLYSVGVLTVVITIVAGAFVGMVLGFQGYYTLVDFGAESSLGLVVALSLTRELGPVLSALLYVGRAGSALTAEIGLMKTTEQLAALEMMAVNPIQRVVAPRLLAGIITVPLLCAMFTFVGIFGGYFIGVVQLGVDAGVYWSAIRDGVDLHQDVANGMIKSVVFGVIVTWIAVFEGYDSYPSAEGISSATTRTVVAGSLAVLGVDYILTALMFRF